jgi:hypothetical protein
LKIFKRSPVKLIIVLLASSLLASCLNDTVQPTIDLNATQLPGTAITLPTTTPELEVTSTPTVAPWLPQLLEPGPPALVSPALFFMDGPDVWLIGNDLATHSVTERRRVRAVETIPGSQMAAVLIIDSAGGRETEEIRIVDAEGTESEPIYGPEIVADPGGNPRVSLLRWSPNGQQLAIVRDDGSIWLSGSGQSAEALDLQTPSANIEDLRWSPTATALVILYRDQGNAGNLRIIAIESGDVLDLQPQRSFDTICWPPGQGTLIVSEDRSAGENPNAGSLFTVRANGSKRELLISAGEFGPAIDIGLTAPSPDGTQLAFTIETPDASGNFSFQALYLLDFATGIQRQIDVFPQLVVSDLWWFEGGLAWRALNSENGSSYSGVEPFVIEVVDQTSGESKLVYTSDGT